MSINYSFLFTVVIPHYNEFSRLKRLLNSLPNRADIQVLVIDDCSPDQAGLNAVKQQFPEVKFLSTPTNQGAGAARNIGLQHAKGDFVLFADADDELHADAFESFDQAIINNADIYYFRADAVIESTGEPSVRANSLNSLVDNYLANPSKENELNLRLKHCVPVAKLYKASFIKSTNIAFDEIPVSNDIYFNTINGVLANKILVSDEIVYRIYRLTDSLTSTLTADRLLCRLQASAKVATELKRLGIKHDRSASGFIVQSLSFGMPTFFKAIIIAVKSDLHLNLTRVVNISRWLSFFKRNNKTHSEINQ